MEDYPLAKSTTIEVKIDAARGVERSLKKFKRLCEAFGIAREFRKRKEFKKPSLKMKEKLKAAEKRRTKTIFKSMRNTVKI